MAWVMVLLSLTAGIVTHSTTYASARCLAVCRHRGNDARLLPGRCRGRDQQLRGEGLRQGGNAGDALAPFLGLPGSLMWEQERSEDTYHCVKNTGCHYKLLGSRCITGHMQDSI